VDQFEYVMVLVSIIIALAIAHLLMAIAEVIHRIRGLGNPIKLDMVYALWIGYVLIWLVSFWWWEFKFKDVAVTWSLGLYFFIVIYAATLFLLATILVPHRMKGVTDSYEYFMRGRKWFFGTLIVLLPIDLIDTFLKGGDWGMRPTYLAQNGVAILSYVAGIVAERRWIQLAAAWAAFAVQLLYFFKDMGVLGSW